MHAWKCGGFRHKAAPMHRHIPHRFLPQYLDDPVTSSFDTCAPGTLPPESLDTHSEFGDFLCHSHHDVSIRLIPGELRLVIDHLLHHIT